GLYTGACGNSARRRGCELHLSIEFASNTGGARCPRALDPFFTIVVQIGTGPEGTPPISHPNQPSMPQIFHRSANTISKLSLAGALVLVAGLVLIAMLIGRSSYVTRANEYVEQPVQFSHLHHVLDDGIDCRYCHTSVETSSFAGIPPTKTCMNCHSQIWSNAPILEPVRASFRDDKPLHWIRVHDLPDFVYFNHSIYAKQRMA